MQRRVLIEVSGIVQGVGFRPYIYRLAKRLQLGGYVKNNSNGVLIEIEGTNQATSSFLTTVTQQPPPLAQITEISNEEIPLTGQTEFQIDSSQTLNHKTTLISPDINTCADCLAELFDPADRRFLYPFINCTNCGPRYTIIRDIPYDRSYTSMKSFDMCTQCQAEYDDPHNRRFHAQPNACPECGPRLIFIDRNAVKITDKPLEKLSQAIISGEIVAIKGIGGFHLAVNAFDSAAVRKLRQRKHRFEKPLALMVQNIETAANIAVIGQAEKYQLLSQHRPIVLCRKREQTQLSEDISPDNNYFGLMLPYSPLHEVILHQLSIDVLVMTSANLSEEPICYQDQECIARMDEIADSYLLHDRDIYIRCDDSVIQCSDQNVCFIRRSRGYAPRPIILKKPGKMVLAVGGHLKNTICLTRDNQAFVSQHIGDLENLQTLDVFENTIRHMKKLFEIEPRLVIHDMHPEYLSTKWAEENTHLPRAAVQHHYAHILSVMAEHGLTESVIGISLDGAGYGEDGHIWGGEVLVCDQFTFKRQVSFDYVPMPGGEKAILQPWRMAVSYLAKNINHGQEIARGFFPQRSQELNVVLQMIEKSINSPMTSSCGRLFDAVSAILGLKETVAYEGQAAIVLQSVAEKGIEKKAPLGDFELVKHKRGWTIKCDKIIEQIVKLKQMKRSEADISLAFHLALARIFTKIAVMLAEETGIHTIALSGGCFQNILLLTMLRKALVRSGLTVYLNQQVPVNDGGISLGQAYWGMQQLKDK